MKRFLLLFLFAKLLQTSLTFGQEEVVLIVNFHAKDDPNRAYPYSLKKQFEKVLGRDRVYYIAIEKKEELSSKLKSVLGPNEKIKVLLFMSHGGSVVETNHLVSKIYSYNDEGFLIETESPSDFPLSTNDEAREVFSGISGRFAPEAIALFDGCNLLDPNMKTAQAQLSTCRNILGIKDGIIYQNFKLGVHPLSLRMLIKYFAFPYWKSKDDLIRFTRKIGQTGFAVLLSSGAITYAIEPRLTPFILGFLALFGALSVKIYNKVKDSQNLGFQLTITDDAEQISSASWFPAVQDALEQCKRSLLKLPLQRAGGEVHGK